MLPDSGDVEVDLSDGEYPKQADTSALVGPGSLARSGPSTKRVYQWIVSSSGDRSEVTIDPVMVCEQFSLTKLGLGKIVAKLVRLGLISSARKRDESGRVIRYDVKVHEFSAASEYTLMDENVANAKSAWVTILEDIEADSGEVARDLFIALCKMADLDGNVAALPSEVMEMIESSEITVFPSSKLSALEDGGRILVTDDTDELCVSVLGFETLRGSFAWRGHQPLPSPD